MSPATASGAQGLHAPQRRGSPQSDRCPARRRVDRSPTHPSLSEQTRRTYASKVRQYLAWLVDADTEGDALGARDARDWAVRDYRTHLQAALKRKPAIVNNALAAIDDLYIRRGLGPVNAARAELPRTAPKALSTRAAVRFLREAQKRPSSRDRAIALVPFYAGARIAETVGLDTDNVRLSARKRILRILGKGERVREIPIHPDLRAALTAWLDERGDWPGADTAGLFLNQRGGRLSVKGAHDIITTIATGAGFQTYLGCTLGLRLQGLAL